MADTTPATSEPTHFVMMATGQIDAGRYEGLDSLFCRYAFCVGDDWKVVSGVEEVCNRAMSRTRRPAERRVRPPISSSSASQGITQLSTSSGSSSDGSQVAVWNFPIDITFRATSAHGWPQIVVAVYGSDAFGRTDMIIGYGSVHLPVAPGRHELYVRTFRPVASSWFAHFNFW